jgi:hypothetical protein
MEKPSLADLEGSRFVGREVHHSWSRRLPGISRRPLTRRAAFWTSLEHLPDKSKRRGIPLDLLTLGWRFTGGACYLLPKLPAYGPPPLLAGGETAAQGSLVRRPRASAIRCRVLPYATPSFPQGGFIPGLTSLHPPSRPLPRSPAPMPVPLLASSNGPQPAY